MQYLATLADETSWSDDYILWDLSMVRGLGIMHVTGLRCEKEMEWVYPRGEEMERGGDGEMGGDMFERWRKVKERL